MPAPIRPIRNDISGADRTYAPLRSPPNTPTPPPIGEDYRITEDGQPRYTQDNQFRQVNQLD